jgi:hypothetical protein
MEMASHKMTAMSTNKEKIETNMENMDEKMDQLEAKITEDIKTTVESTLQKTLQSVVSTNINNSLQETKNDINDLKYKINRMFQHLMPSTNPPENIPLNSGPIQKPAPTPTPVEATTQPTNFFSTLSPATARKSLIAKPINRWNHPKQVAKSRSSPMVKKITDKSGKLNTTLTNFFNALFPNQDESENQMEDGPL